jgi:hypothetical protein
MKKFDAVVTDDDDERRRMAKNMVPVCRAMEHLDLEDQLAVVANMMLVLGAELHFEGSDAMTPRMRVVHFFSHIGEGAAR